MYVRLGQTDSGFYHLVQGILKFDIVHLEKLLKLDLMDSDEHFFHA
jgi:hypothetical protein